jgi:hypothetical protein
MGKRGLRRRIESLVGRQHDHQIKIEREKNKVAPDFGLIRHWETEIEAFQESIDRALKRLTT